MPGQAEREKEQEGEREGGLREEKVGGRETGVRLKM